MHTYTHTNVLCVCNWITIYTQMYVRSNFWRYSEVAANLNSIQQGISERKFLLALGSMGLNRG